jgi:hypothetical protein
VIIDTLGSNCFVLGLDRVLVPAPSSMMDMIHKIKHGVYDIDFRSIKKVTSPPMKVFPVKGTVVLFRRGENKYSSWIVKQFYKPPPPPPVHRCL